MEEKDILVRWVFCVQYRRSFISHNSKIYRKSRLETSSHHLKVVGFRLKYLYEKIWQELSAIEKDILIAMTQIKSKKVKDIREVLNSKSNDFSVYRTRLIRKGVVYSPSYGELDFTLPLFDKFVLDQA